MKIIEKTPFQTEKGEISLLDRVQGMLRYGFSWYSELEAQNTVIDQLNRVFEKGFVLIHNLTLTLPGVEIMEPIILIGPGGIYVIYVTHVRGQYEAKGDQWNVVDNNGRPQSASVNLMGLAARHAKAVERYLQIQKIDVPSPAPVEPVLIAANPGMHIDSTRPVVRVVQSDAVKQFAASLLQAKPIFTTEYIYNLADRIVAPQSKSEVEPRPAAPAPAPEAVSAPPAGNAAARAHAIFDASAQAQPFNPADLGFALQEAPAGQPEAVPQNLRESSPSQPLPPPKPRRRGMSFMQIAVLGFILLVWVCILAVFGYLIFFSK